MTDSYRRYEAERAAYARGEHELCFAPPRELLRRIWAWITRRAA